jgi:ADP-ribose pyrophosphatase
MPIEPWKILESSYLRPRIRVDKCELPNGKVFEPMVFEFRPWANVLALTKDREAVLVRQYRHGVQEILLELPGGILEDGEEPSDGVKRELLEETGYGTSGMIQVGKLYANPAIQTNTMYCFLALDVEKVADQKLDETEELEVQLVPLEELIAMVKRGEFLHGLQVAALFHCLAYMDRIK